MCLFVSFVLSKNTIFDSNSEPSGSALSERISLHMAILQIDIWEQLSSVAGLVGVILGTATVTLWVELKAKDKALKTLNEQVNRESRESMKIITSFEGLLDRMLSAQADGEKRILASVASEASHIKELIYAYKEDHIKKA